MIWDGLLSTLVLVIWITLDGVEKQTIGVGSDPVRISTRGGFPSLGRQLSRAAVTSLWAAVHL